MQKKLILADLHLKTDLADKIINHVNPDKIIFSNDIFDDYGDTVEQNIKAATWLKEKIQNPNNIFLQSNHVISYQFPNNYNACCSGFTTEKSKAINSVLSKEDYAKLKTYHIEHDILITHAGLSRMWAKTYMGDDYKHLNLKTIKNYLDYKTPIALDLYSIGAGDSLFGCGRSRGGNLAFGSCIWEDARQFFPIKGVSQSALQTIFHKPQFCVTTKSGYGKLYNYDDKELAERFKREPKFNPSSFNLFMDTNLRNYAIIEEDRLSLYETDGFKKIFEKYLGK